MTKRENEYRDVNDIIEHPRVNDNDEYPNYVSDVCNIRKVERENLRNLHAFNKPKRGTTIENVGTDFSERKNTRSEWEEDYMHSGKGNRLYKKEND